MNQSVFPSTWLLLQQETRPLDISIPLFEESCHDPQDIKVTNHDSDFFIVKWLAFAIYRFTQSRDYSSSLSPPLSLSLFLFLTRFPSLSFAFITSERYLFFFFIAASSRFVTIYSAHGGGGVLRPFSTPLTTRHPLYPLAP